MRYFLRIGPGGIVTTLLLIPLLILLILFIPALIIILLIAAAAGAVFMLISRTIRLGAKKTKGKTAKHKGRVIDVEYEIK